MDASRQLVPKEAVLAAAGRQLGFFGPVRLIIVSAIMLSSIVVVAASIILMNMYHRVLAENERTLSTAVSIFAKQIEETLTTVQTVEREINDDFLRLPKNDNDAAEDRFARYGADLNLIDKVRGMPYVASLAVYDAQGRTIKSSSRQPVMESVVERDFFRALQFEAASFLGEPIRTQASGSWILPMAQRISGPNGEFLGAISAAIDLQYLQNYFKRIGAEPNNSIALFSSEGTLLARFPEEDTELGRRFPNAIALKLISRSDLGVGMSDGVIGSSARMVAAHRISNFPIVVTATRSSTAILANWYKSAGYIAIASLVVIGIIAAFAALFMRLFRNYQSLVRARSDSIKAAQFREQNLRFDVALNNMSQGLVMFNAQSNLVVWNNRFLRMYGLSPQIVQPGLPLLDLLKHRKETGSFDGDPYEYHSKLMAQILARKKTAQTVATPAGRIIEIVSQPMSGGGWVATHEDITDEVATEDSKRKQEEQLNAALENISQGVCMFDASRRLIICNRRYAELYGLSDEQTKPGTPLETILEHRIASGNAPNDHEVYIRDRLNEVSINLPYETVNQLRDGRLVSVVHRPMANGGWVATHQDVTEAKRREESFRLLFEGSPVAMWVVDRDSLRFLAVNEAAIASYGYTRAQFLSMTVTDLRPTEDSERFISFMKNLPDDQFTENIGQHTKADGTQIDVAVHSRALIYDGHNARLAAVHDITNTKRAEAELRRTKIFFDAVVEHVPVPIVVTKIAGSGADTRSDGFSLFNRAYEELTGDSRVGLIGKKPHEIFPKERADLIVQSDNEALQVGRVAFTPEHQILTAHNGTRLVTAKKTAIRDEYGQAQYLLTVLDDVTERRRAEQHISHLAHNDSLTNLPNRTAFLEYLGSTLDRAIKSDQPFAILCLDLDRFKEANDVYGHLVGDGLLREAACRLQAAARGAFLARIGGDEFILVLTDNATQETVEVLGDRLLAAFKNDFEIDGHRIQVGLSIGIALFPIDGTDTKTLIANADAALYQAKSEVRGSARFFEAKLGARLRERREIQTDLHAALDRDELFLHYQPQKTIISGKIVGFEGLARWRCPKRGDVPPGVFIPIAEDSSLIIRLGEWVLREACKEAASWPTPLKIAVNISPIQFHHGDLPSLVHSILLETGLRPTRLELEITEGVLIDDFGRAVSVLRKLKSLGICIAMDDFGSGYSSLSYLHAFPFEKIKIDRTFIGDLDTNHHSKAIVRAIITLGRSLEIPTLAEGVETEAQFSILAQEGCDEVQGYFIGRPYPIEAYAELVGRSRNRRRHAV